MCASTRRYLTKDDVIGEITGPIVRWLSGIKEKNLNGCGKLTLASDLSDIADMTHVDLSNMNSLTGTSRVNIPRNFLEIHPANSWKYLFANSQSHVGDRGILRKLLPNCEIYT